MSRYPRQFALFTTLYLLGAAAVNVCVDPERVFGLVELDLLAPYKARALDPLAKAEVALRTPPDVALIGDSRVMIGIDPRHHALTQFGRVENLAFAGANPDEAARMLELTLESKPPQLILWGVDPEGWGSLGNPQLEPRTLATRLNPDLDLWSYYRRHLIGAPSLNASYHAFRRSLFRRSVRWTNSGQKIDWEARSPDPHRANVDTLRHRVQMRSNLTDEADTGVDHAAPLFRRIQQAGTRLVLFLSPSHALFHDANYRQPDRRRYAERCLIDLVVLVEHLNESAPDQPPIELWDFTGFSPVHAESFPQPGGSSTLQWHWDAVHFQDSLGDLMLRRIFDGATQPADFGVRLTSNTLPQHLAEWSVDLATYEREQPDQTSVLTAWEDSVRK